MLIAWWASLADLFITLLAHHIHFRFTFVLLRALLGGTGTAVEAAFAPTLLTLLARGFYREHGGLHQEEEVDEKVTKQAS